ncbi:hypothetical protein PFISCL1PPCAC_16374, partial [Pristionchus fissidentatus]
TSGSSLALLALAVDILHSSLGDVTTLGRLADRAQATLGTGEASLLESLEFVSQFVENESVVGSSLLSHGITHVLRRTILSLDTRLKGYVGGVIVGGDDLVSIGVLLITLAAARRLGEAVLL